MSLGKMIKQIDDGVVEGKSLDVVSAGDRGYALDIYASLFSKDKEALEQIKSKLQSGELVIRITSR